MQLEDKPEFAKLIMNADLLTVRDKNKSIDDLINLMFAMLSEHDLEDIRVAVLEHVKHEKYFPQVSDIINKIEGTAKERATQAWRALLAVLKRRGYYDSLRFPDPAYHYAIEALGGWQRLSSNLDESNMPYVRRDFETAYILGEKIASWQSEPGKTKVAPWLRGFFETNNASKGHSPKVLDAMTGRVLKYNPALLSPNAKASESKISSLSGKLVEGMKAIGQASDKG